MRHTRCRNKQVLCGIWHASENRRPLCCRRRFKLNKRLQPWFEPTSDAFCVRGNLGLRLGVKLGPVPKARGRHVFNFAFV